MPVSFFKEKEKERAGSWLIEGVERSGRSWGREKHDQSILYTKFAIKMVLYRMHTIGEFLKIHC